MSEGKATLPTELLYLPLTDEALAVQHLIILKLKQAVSTLAR